MKKVFAFLTVAFLLSSCGDNVAKYKPMIEELTGKWDTATTAVTDFANTVKSQQTETMNLSNSLQMDASVMESWDDETKAKFGNIQSMAQNGTNGLAALQGDLDGFISSWMEKGKDLQALKDGLAAGKIEGDVQGQIASLTAATTDATSKLDGWKEQFGKIQSAIADATNMFSEFQTAANLR